MNHRLTAIAMAGTLMGTFVLAPMAAMAAKPTSKLSVAQRPTSKALQNLDVTGTLLQNAGTFQGTVSVTQFGYDPAAKQLTVSGVLNGTATKADGTTTPINSLKFTDVAATLTSSTNTKQVGSCDILFLDIGPIFLDLLGLQVDLSQIVLDIDAVAGAGNLLGNLLCALVNLLNGGPLASILQLINQINAILSSL